MAKWAVECQCHLSDSIDIKDIFWDYMNLFEFLISSVHLQQMHLVVANVV